MIPSASGALAVELHPRTPTQWIATYYPMVDTPAGRWADVTRPLHRCLMPITEESPESARWLDLRSPDPGHRGYAHHRLWSQALATGYATALAIYHAAAPAETLPPESSPQLRGGTVVVPAGQLSEWVLDDLEEEASQLRR